MSARPSTNGEHPMSIPAGTSLPAGTGPTSSGSAGRSRREAEGSKAVAEVVSPEGEEKDAGFSDTYGD